MLLWGDEMLVLKYIVSGIGFFSSIGATLIKGNTKKQFALMIILTFFSNFFTALGYIFNPEGLNGVASCALGCIICLVNLFFRSKELPIPKIVLAIYYIGFFVINIINRSTLVLTTIAILATFTFVANLSQKGGKGFRIWKLANNLLWGLYDIISGSYNQLIVLHIPIASVTLYSIYQFDIRKSK